MASAKPPIKPEYENDSVIEKLPIRNIAVSKPSLKIAKNMMRKIPQPALSTAWLASSFKAAVAPTCFESQKITYQIRPAVAIMATPSKSASIDALPIELLT